MYSKYNTEFRINYIALAIEHNTTVISEYAAKLYNAVYEDHNASIPSLLTVFLSSLATSFKSASSKA